MFTQFRRMTVILAGITPGLRQEELRPLRRLVLRPSHRLGPRRAPYVSYPGPAAPAARPDLPGPPGPVDALAQSCLGHDELEHGPLVHHEDHPQGVYLSGQALDPGRPARTARPRRSPRRSRRASA